MRKCSQVSVNGMLYNIEWLDDARTSLDAEMEYVYAEFGLAALRKFSVIVADDASAAFRYENKPFLVGAGCAEHRQN